MSDCNNIPFFEDDLHCYEDFKHHHEDPKPCDDHVKCCPDTDCAPLKPNCKPECCEGLPPVIPDLSKAYAVPTLVNRIFDCIKLESPNFAIKEQDFKIISTPPPNTSYNKGDKVCIDKICVKYDVIGPVFSHNEMHQTHNTKPITTVCSTKVQPQAVPGSSIPYPKEHYEGTTDSTKEYDHHDKYISNNLIFSVNNTSCCYEHHHVKDGKQCKVVEQNIPFRILGLKIIVTGRAGCLPFTAEYVSHDTELHKTLGLPDNYNFFGKLCIPQSNSGVTIRENFESCLSIDCIEPKTDLYKGHHSNDYIESDIVEDTTNAEKTNDSIATDGHGGFHSNFKFKADIESSLLIKKTIFALAEEKLSVLAIPTPRKQQCHKPEHDNPCHPCSYDME